MMVPKRATHNVNCQCLHEKDYVSFGIVQNDNTLSRFGTTCTGLAKTVKSKPRDTLTCSNKKWIKYYFANAGVLRSRQTVLERNLRHHAPHWGSSARRGSERSHPTLREALQRVLRPPGVHICHAAYLLLDAQGDGWLLV